MRIVRSEQKMMKTHFAYAIGVSIFTIPVALLIHSGAFDWEDPLSNKEALVSIFMILISAVILGLALDMKLFVKMDSKGIEFQMKPINFKTKKIPIGSIESIKIIPYNLSFSKGLGYHTNLSGHHYYALKLGHALEIRTKDSKLYNLGIEKSSLWQQSVEAINKEINNGG